MGIIDFAVKNWRFTLVAFIGVFAIGLSALFSMPRAEDPPYNAPVYAVVAVYPGTSAQDMEKLVVKPVEKHLQKLEKLKRISTEIRAGVAAFRIDYQYGVDSNEKYQELTREIGALRAQLPADLASLEVRKASSSDVKIEQYALTADKVSPAIAKEWAQKLKDRLSVVKSLKSVDVWATVDQEVRVELSLDRLAASRIPVNRVLGALQANNVNVPGGGLGIGSKKLDVKTTGELDSIEDLKNTVVSTTGSKIVLLQDVANVEPAYSDRTYLARVNGIECVFVTASMHDGQNIQSVKSLVEPIVADFERSLPSTIELVHVFDQPKGVDERLARFSKDFALAIVLVLLTLLPLGFRASLVVMIAIPLSLAIGLTILNLLGYSINQLSIVGMILALGILVDDSIVVVENTERWLREGVERQKASVAAARQIAAAIAGCTVLIVLAFLPLIFLPEGSGEFIRSLPMAVVACVAASLLVALTVVPFLSSRILAKEKSGHGNVFLRFVDRWVIQASEPLVARALKYPKTTFAAAMGLFVLSLGLFPIIGQSLFPKSEKPMFLVNVQMPAGSNLEATDRVARRVETLLLGREGIASVATNVGHDNPQVYYNVSPKDNAENVAQLFVQLSTEEGRFKHETIERLREEVKAIAGPKIEVKEFEQGPPVDAPLAYRLFGEDLEALDRAAAQVEALLTETTGTIYVSNPLKVKPMDMQVRIHREKAGLMGVSAADVSRAVRLGVTGLTVGKIRVEGDRDDWPIRVTLERAARLSDSEVFDRIYVDSPTASLPLGQLVEIGFDTGVTQIRHWDRKRTVTVGAFVQTGYNVGRVNQDVLSRLNELTLPQGVTFEVAGEVESSRESFSGLGTIILITVFGFIGVLILEFKSFKSLLIVLSIVPLGIVGALVMLFLFGESFSFTATVGLIALTGIEVKNSILLVDFANLLRSQGKGLDEAIKEAGRMRFVPILLTSLTAIGGLIPLVVEYSPLYSPLALVLIGGIASSTVMARFVTPVVYKLFAPKVEADGVENLN